MRKMIFIICIAVSSILFSSCCVFKDDTQGNMDKGLLESSIKMNDVILTEYERYVKNDKNLSVSDKMARILNLKSYQLLLRDRASKYNEQFVADK